MDLQIKGRRALVTGASKGLGRAIAGALADEGASVAVCARNGEAIARAASEIGGRGFVAELGKEGAVDALVADVRQALGGVDILVINTGGPPGAGFDGITDAMWRESYEGLWMSTVQLIRAVLPEMRERRWGRILLVTSISAREPLPNLTISNALRPGLHGLVNTLSREVARDGITVNALMPGYTLTERLKDLAVDEVAISQQIPAGRMGRPDEFAALAAFLASERAAYVNGQAIACDGGLGRAI
jgi:3-oxoacyl-[acyl-carrier protein] reductase